MTMSISLAALRLCLRGSKGGNAGAVLQEPLSFKRATVERLLAAKKPPSE
jgi:hypothetical protein